MNLFSKPRKVADVYRQLRNQALSLTADQIGLHPEPSDPIVGALMETGYKEAVVTLVVMGEGTVSLYFSNGGGIIGLGEHAGPRDAGLSFLKLASQFMSHLQPAKDFPLPQTGNTTFYLRTSSGVMTVTAKEADLGNNRHPLSPLFHKAHEVIGQARLVDEKRQRDFRELMSATVDGDVNRVKALVVSGANLNASDDTGLTPLMAAAHSGRAEIIELLLEAGVPIDTKDSSGYTALMYACNAGQLECACRLLERGANVNEEDNDGSTPIMFSSQNGQNELVRLLLEKGADPTKEGHHGLSAIGFAKQNGLTETEKILRGAG